MKEIADYLRKHYEQDKIINCKTISAKLKSTGSTIGYYLGGHKQEIIDLALEENEDAKYICEQVGWLNKEAKIVKEIADYLRKHYPQGEIKNYQAISDMLESIGGEIGNYLAKHKLEIIEMALNKNEDAISICTRIRVFKKDLYKRLDEIASNDSYFQKVKESIENKMEVKIAK